MICVPAQSGPSIPAVSQTPFCPKIPPCPLSAARRLDSCWFMRIIVNLPLEDATKSFLSAPDNPTELIVVIVITIIL